MSKPTSPLPLITSKYPDQVSVARRAWMGPEHRIHFIVDEMRDTVTTSCELDPTRKFGRR